MKALKRCLIAALPLALCGCLEVDQHPAWLDGGYAGKIDQMPAQQHFHRDRLAWSAAVTNRALYQNEYIRAKPPGEPGYKTMAETGATPAENTGPKPAGAQPASAHGAQAPAAAGKTAPANTGAPTAPATGVKPPAS